MFQFYIRNFVEVVVLSLHTPFTIHRKVTILVVNAKELLDVYCMAIYEHLDFNAYETLVRTFCTEAKLHCIDFDGLQRLVYVDGFQGEEFADYKTRLLRKLEKAGKLSIKDLTAEYQAHQVLQEGREDARKCGNGDFNGQLRSQKEEARIQTT
ncbi:unnamed protein product [Heligmosomoides polygyrus]|uniref:BTB domain-containing protein n=1 Tax=Heligmosomoides polygyrus TaxID=6339 RepID=A0A3P8G1C4_HELPZ|nr:unnamed protein product [Heligmosomoides polygyrus]